MISSGEKKALSIIAIVVVVFVAVVGTSVFFLTRDDDKNHEPYLHLAVGDQLHTIEPRWWCNLMLTSCDPEFTAKRPTAKVPVPVGTTVMLTVSSEIADGLWNLLAVYRTPDNLADEVEYKHTTPGERYSMTLESTPDRVLLGVTVVPASARLDQNDELLPRGELAVETAPAE
ncbi:DUF2771 family protein [Gordonia westfalica]|uniref:DUF2771 family protein n=1 Tax=Gordonia westfalica TaxID=158898 RepID=A0ABU2GXC9_9ACTN|nr:DUF2771 family protein [Gordonia westfalica]MDS1116071.1 DUF2771 family protein [Gordonia westfalica]